jgi:hypothetical protein
MEAPAWSAVLRLGAPTNLARAHILGHVAVLTDPEGEVPVTPSWRGRNDLPAGRRGTPEAPAHVGRCRRGGRSASLAPVCPSRCGLRLPTTLAQGGIGIARLNRQRPSAGGALPGPPPPGRRAAWVRFQRSVARSARASTRVADPGSLCRRRFQRGGARVPRPSARALSLALRAEIELTPQSGSGGAAERLQRRHRRRRLATRFRVAETCC